MKLLLLALSFAAVTLTGCLDMGTTSKMYDQHESAAKSEPKRPPAVQPDAVNDANAHDMAAALKAEMDFDARKVP